MYLKKIDDKLHRKMEKLVKKNRFLALQIYSKMEEIVRNPHHYKPLRGSMKNKRRAHVGHFVIIYEINYDEKAIYFLAFEHHDDAYV